jgi:hypothetical protein
VLHSFSVDEEPCYGARQHEIVKRVVFEETSLSLPARRVGKMDMGRQKRNWTPLNDQAAESDPFDFPRSPPITKVGRFQRLHCARKT